MTALILTGPRVCAWLHSRKRPTLKYYLYRYYDPNLQRWPNRDPLGESGG